jgi:hypothetical protein
MENLMRRDCFRNIGVDGRIILNQMLEKRVVTVHTGLNWLRTESNGNFHNNDSERFGNPCVDEKIILKYILEY